MGIAQPMTMEPRLPTTMNGHSGMFFFIIVIIEIGGGSFSSAPSITDSLSSSLVWKSDPVEEALLPVLGSLLSFCVLSMQVHIRNKKPS